MKEKKNKSIAIIGAGMTGLVAGYRLSQMGNKVVIFEKNSDIGGLMGGFKIGETSLEKAYHHIFRTDKYIIDLANELGLGDRLKWYPEKTALYFEHKMYPFMGVVDLLKFKPLDPVSKIRLGLVKIYLENDNNWEKYKKITAVDWMKKYCGEDGYKIIWEPLLKGKFHDYYDKVSMAWLWARIYTRANSDGYLGYFDGGFRIIADELAKRIKKNGGEIRLKTEVDFKKIENDFDKILYTGAAKNINYLGAVNIIFTSKQNLSPYYWHNINDVKSPFLCFIQHTNLVDKKNYGGKNVYYLGAYLPNDDKQFTMDEAKLKKDWFDYLKKIIPDFEIKKVEKVWVNKFKNAQHIVTTDYQVPKPTLPSLEKGGKKIKIYQANFAQIFPEDRGTNFAVREGEKIAEWMEK